MANSVYDELRAKRGAQRAAMEAREEQRKFNRLTPAEQAKYAPRQGAQGQGAPPGRLAPLPPLLPAAVAPGRPRSGAPHEPPGRTGPREESSSTRAMSS